MFHVKQVYPGLSISILIKDCGSNGIRQGATKKEARKKIVKCQADKKTAPPASTHPNYFGEVPEQCEVGRCASPHQVDEGDPAKPDMDRVSHGIPRPTPCAGPCRNLRRNWRENGLDDPPGKTVSIVGDIPHSRVARCNVKLLGAPKRT